MTQIDQVHVEEVRQVLRASMLPIINDNEDKCLEKCIEQIEIYCDEHADSATWLKAKFVEWQTDGLISRELKVIVEKMFNQPDIEFGETIGKEYFRLHTALQTSHKIAPETSTVFLSHLPVILSLCKTFKMSASQIAKVLAARDSRLTYSWRAIQTILAKFSLKPKITDDQVKELYRNDTVREEEFADADVVEATEIVAGIALGLGFKGEMLDILQNLSNNQNNSFLPYLQILHFQCIIAEYYDHALTFAYEFEPRGTKVNWLVEQYSSEGNPFLNNAKSVEQLNMSWAESKQGQVKEARSLAQLLLGMEDMSFAGKRELAGWVRRWVLRVLRLSNPAENLVPIEITTEQIQRLVNYVIEQPTNTLGIIEQRTVDAWATMMYSRDDGWHPQGLGDSVNATNISRRKLGDCEFQHINELHIVAIEVHAGKLTQNYVDEHCRSVKKSLAAKREELMGIADPDRWQIDIVFVAHEIAVTTRFIPLQLEGFTLNLSGKTFKDFFEERAFPDETTKSKVSAWVSTRLNQPSTPRRVRDRFLEIVNTEE